MEKPVARHINEMDCSLGDFSIMLIEKIYEKDVGLHGLKERDWNLTLRLLTLEDLNLDL